MKQYSVKLILLLSMALYSFASDKESVITRINRSYDQNKQMALEISYKMFENPNTTVPFETQSGKYYKNEGKEYSELLNILTLRLSDKTILINKDQKQIKLEKPSKAAVLSVAPNTNLNGIEKYATLKESVKGDKGILSYSFNDKTHFQYDKLEIHYFSKTYLIDKIVIYYNDKNKFVLNEGDKKHSNPRLEISFDKTVLNPKFPPGIFNAASYVNFGSKKVMPSEAFKEYTIVNHLIN